MMTSLNVLLRKFMLLSKIRYVHFTGNRFA